MAHLIQIQTPRPGSRPAIFVSWTGDRTLAVVSISTTQRAQKTADIGDYDFTVEKSETGNVLYTELMGSSQSSTVK